MSRVTEYSDDDDKTLNETAARPAGGEAVERPSRLPKLSFGGRIRESYQNVKLELRKTSWATRIEVWSTTVVVLIAIFFFGFYLWGVGRLITRGFEALE